MTIREQFEIPKRYNTVVYGADGSRYYICHYCFMLHMVQVIANMKEQDFGQPFAKQCILFIGGECCYVFYLCYYACMGWLANAFRRVPEAISTCCSCYWCYYVLLFYWQLFLAAIMIFIIGQIPEAVQHDRYLKA